MSFLRSSNLLTFLIKRLGNRITSALQQRLHLLDVIFNPKQVRAIERKCVDADPDISKKNSLLILYGDTLLYSEVDVRIFDCLMYISNFLCGRRMAYGTFHQLRTRWSYSG